LGQNEDFFVALWIFQPKTAIFAVGWQIYGFLAATPSQWPGFISASL